MGIRNFRARDMRGTAPAETQGRHARPSPTLVWSVDVEHPEAIAFTVAGVPDDSQLRIQYGDGAGEELAGLTASHAYADSGTYTVTAEVTGPDGVRRGAIAEVVVIGLLTPYNEAETVNATGSSDVPEGTSREILAWVDGDAGRAQAALDAENGRTAPRVTLISELEKLTAAERE